MAHPRLTRSRMFDWIRSCIDTSQPLPTDAAIVEQFDLSGVESARSLLADLADAGKITITGFGADRVITLGRIVARPEPLLRVEPSVVKRRNGLRPGDLDAGLAKIAAVLARGRAAVAPDTSTVSAPEGEIESRSAPALAAAKRKAPLPRPTERAAAVSACDSAMRAARRQLNISFPPSEFAKLEALASAAGMLPVPYARERMLALLNGAALGTTKRTIVPAALVAVAIRDGFPVVDFAQRMMALGLAAYASEMAVSA